MNVNVSRLQLLNAAMCLDECEAAQADLRAKPSKLPPAIEEVLRFRSPVARMERVGARDVWLHGRLMAARR